jgi:hypothetical protein
MNLDEALAKIAELEGVISSKDEVILEKDNQIDKLNNVAREQAGNFKKLRDMTQAERDQLTEKELELMKRQEAHEEKMAKFESEQKEFTQKQKDSVINNLANKMSRGDEEIAKQIKLNLTKLNPELLTSAITEEELAPHVESAYNMLGIQTKPDPLYEAHHTSGRTAPIESANNFADTQEGKQAASMMGLSIGKENNNQ